MKKIILLFIFTATVGFTPQRESAFDVGEQFVFRINYGFLSAGYATLEVKEVTQNHKNIFSRYRERIYNGNVSIFF